MTFQPAPTLTVENARSMLAAGLQAIESGQHVIDFSGITAVDSAAVAVLLSWQKAALRKSIELSFINMPAMLENLADLYGVVSLLPAQVDLSSFLAPVVPVAGKAGSSNAVRNS